MASKKITLKDAALLGILAEIPTSTSSRSVFRKKLTSAEAQKIEKSLPKVVKVSVNRANSAFRRRR